MNTFNPNRAGLALGLLFGLMHLLWVLAVAMGWGQTLLQWGMNKHFVSGALTVGSVGWGMALLGIVAAFVCGYITAAVFSWLYNMLGKK